MKPEILQTKNFEVIGRLLNYPVICLYYKRIKIIEYHYHTNLTGELFKFLKIIRIRKQINKISDDELLILGTYLIYYLMDIYGDKIYSTILGKKWYNNTIKFLDLNFDLNSKVLLEVIEKYENITFSNISKCFKTLQ